MAVSDTPRDGNKPFDYLCVDAFIESVVDARALDTAFELGLIDSLVGANPAMDEIQERLQCDSRGLRFLIDLLKANRVIEEISGRITLSRRFLHALQYRDVLEAKLQFADFLCSDFTEHFTTLLTRPDRFARVSRVFDLFDYNRCLAYTPENYERTRRWVRITTSLTRHEAQACIYCHDFRPYRRMLDIGGNSGEFALQLCKKHAGLSAVVVDLPLVCDIGQEHIRPESEADRITFVKANALSDPLPCGFDLVIFKSMLHDWPEKEAALLIGRAARSLLPGGTLLIFERGPMDIEESTPPYSWLPFLLFFRSFRSPSVYENHLRGRGFQDIRVRKIDLGMPFFILTGKKTAQEPFE